MFHMKPSLLLSLVLFPLSIFCQTSTVTLQVKPINFPKVRDQEVEQWNHKQPEFAKLDDNAKEFLYWTNYSRINPSRFFK